MTDLTVSKPAVLEIAFITRHIFLLAGKIDIFQ